MGAIIQESGGAFAGICTEQQQPDRGAAHHERWQFQEGRDLAFQETSSRPGADESGAAEKQQQDR